MSNRERYIRRRAAAYGLDPDAVVAISMHECPSCLAGHNTAGDHGTSFGPFQLHAGGALPKGKGNAWANSAAGIDYALRQMSGVARGLSGKAAITAISTRFERPADPAGEIADAMAHYGNVGAPDGPLGAARQTIGGAATSAMKDKAFRSMVAAQMLDQAAATAQGRPPDTSGLLALAVARRQFQDAQDTYGQTPQKGVGLTGQRQMGPVKFIGNTHGENPAFLNKLGQAAASVGGTAIRVTSGYRDPKTNARVGGVPHSNHMTGHAMDGEVFIPGRGWVPLGVALQSAAAKYGLRSGNVPGFYHGGLDPVHVDDGFNQH